MGQILELFQKMKIHPGSAISVFTLRLTPGLYPSYQNGRKSSYNHRESARGRKYPSNNSPKLNAKLGACRRKCMHAFSDLEGCPMTRSHSNYCDTFQPIDIP
ncbi:hypothetical protein CR513_15557, partial [Mucuna pruriens]